MLGEGLGNLGPPALGDHRDAELGEGHTMWLSEQTALPVCSSGARAGEAGISRPLA